MRPAQRLALSERELDVVRKVVEGLSNDEIAVDLGISPKTVESHMRRIFERVGVVSRTELATRALREGWLDLPLQEQPPERLEFGSMEERTHRSRRRRVIALVLFVIGFVLVWEGAKWIAGDPWRIEVESATSISRRSASVQLTDLNLPHLWEIAAAFGEPFQRNANYSLANYLVEQAAYTWAEALLGFGFGALIGIVLASIFVHFGLFERAFVPYVVASQTIPIVALAPVIVVSFGRGLTSVVIIATYLTFFPVTIAVVRGLRSPDPRAIELMRSYAASKWDVYRKVRLPASVPYLFTGAQDRRRREHRGHDHRRGAGGSAAGPRPRDPQLQPAVHHRPREAVGNDPHRRGRGHPVLPDRPRRRDPVSAPPWRPESVSS